MNRTDWFHDARWGVSSHYLVPAKMSAEEWSALVDAFDVDGLAGQLAEAGAGYYMLTVGQNSGHYCSPNATYDGFVKHIPSKCSRRDLIADLAAALDRRGIAMLAYLPSGAPTQDPVAMDTLEWEWGYEGVWPGGWRDELRTGKRLAAFQRKWEAVIREWSLRWGYSMRGWWFDGCYFADEMYHRVDEPNFFSFAAAARAGNPDAIVAFNPGIMMKRLTEAEDFVAGETNEPATIECAGRWLSGSQFHMWSYLGSDWMKPPLRFTTEVAVSHTLRVVSKGGVVTWDVPLAETGTLADDVLAQLTAIGRAIRDSSTLQRG